MLILERKTEMKVLIVDDSRLMRLMLKNILEKGGYEVVGDASTGLEALDKLKECNPDVITLDITMPSMDGLSALKRIKEIKSDVLVVMCTAMGQKFMVTEAMRNGASDFIVKPFKPERILKCMKKLEGR
jgi:two-component system chemotaxis response regulator CheY